MRFESPTTTKAAATLLASESGVAHVLAGGTDLLVRMKMGSIEPDLVVDIKRIESLRTLKVAAAGVQIGAAVPAVRLGESDKLRSLWPGVVEAANLIGSDQIQGRCTVVGNLCNASPAADSVPALIAAGAKALVVGPKGKRRVAVEKVVLGPGRTSLARDEFIEAVVLPARTGKSADAYLRFTPRTEMDIAVVSAAINLTLSRGIVQSAKVVLGAVAPTAVIVPAAAKALIGTKLDDAALDKMVAACRAACNPIDDKRGTIAYRTKVAGVMARRAALIAYERAGGSK
ncbi:MAG TPA: oxidoreductase [Gammaproteobacteria bacterium]|jgi:carbon-monoxide dehydrogenase medium subunit|nr:xanthine dehydrogenase family protein subunit M [Gammaproteobacteria bacterium]MDA8863597.1 xanthine dehydrogenase family protein subunit M [Pseudomonadales bacterium]MDB4035202.1 xanthine dehydrogenase family protein subunit M [Pseudomonadales bacterium]MDC1238981.1 xanthine dehydrogenase family protein subunit M [Pseudomonadales bacterium]MDO7572811.1 xanthine dehydrogenase family protein subunit M [Pseudomonadales bacterium]